MSCQAFWIADPAVFLVIHWWFVAIKCPDIDVGLNAAFMHSALRDASRWPFCRLGVPLCRLTVRRKLWRLEGLVQSALTLPV